MNELALFSGAGGGILGGHLLGWRTICAVEYDAYAASVLVSRQNDGCLAPFPIWDDVRTFDGKPWRGIVDVVSGGFPCQDISAAGRGAGIDGERSGLWAEMARIIGEVRPRFAFVENSPMLTSRGLGRVLGDLAELGYDAKWGVVSAADAIFAAGDPCAYHLRERIWIVATDASQVRRDARWSKQSLQRPRASSDVWPTTTDATQAGTGPNDEGLRSGVGGTARRSRATADANGTRLEKREGKPSNNATQQPTAKRAYWWQTEPAVGRVVDGLANRVDRLGCIGNGQVAAVAAMAWRFLTEEHQ